MKLKKYLEFLENKKLRITIMTTLPEPDSIELFPTLDQKNLKEITKILLKSGYITWITLVDPYKGPLKQVYRKIYSIEELDKVINLIISEYLVKNI